MLSLLACEDLGGFTFFRFVVIDVGFSVTHTIVGVVGFTLTILFESVGLFEFDAFLLSLSLDILFLLCFALGLELTLILEGVQLLLDLFGSLVLKSMEHHVTTAEAFLDLNKAQLESRAQLVQSDRNLRVFLLVLIVRWERDLTAG